MNYDRSDNEIKDVDKDTIICDCGKRQMFTVFEVIVVAAVLVFFMYVMLPIVLHCRKMYLKRKEHSAKLKIEKRKSFRELVRN